MGLMPTPRSPPYFLIPALQETGVPVQVALVPTTSCFWPTHQISRTQNTAGVGRENQDPVMHSVTFLGRLGPPASGDHTDMLEDPHHPLAVSNQRHMCSQHSLMRCPAAFPTVASPVPSHLPGKP